MTCRTKSQELLQSGGRCIGVSVARQTQRRFFTQKVGLRRSTSAVCRSSVAVRQSSCCNTSATSISTPGAGLLHSGSGMQRLSRRWAGTRCIWQAVHRFAPHKEFP
ncbi:hypothetical protein NDU88_007941 [Pleurodeles waltl]|uniref:Uncharacterized protein n=1 Tax=Pleurodeles waltl TaxID=8319 RepID=A0AAV7RRQ8_PLEWA|nr:hypothetical protein NDU88_007941 [Pleurodeles waltl]